MIIQTREQKITDTFRIQTKVVMIIITAVMKARTTTTVTINKCNDSEELS